MNTNPSFISFLLFFLFQFQLEDKFSTAGTETNGMEKLNSMLGVSHFPYRSSTREDDKAIPMGKGLSYICASVPGERTGGNQSLQRGRSQAFGSVQKHRWSASVNMSTCMAGDHMPMALEKGVGKKIQSLLFKLDDGVVVDRRNRVDFTKSHADFTPSALKVSSVRKKDKFECVVVYRRNSVDHRNETIVNVAGGPQLRVFMVIPIKDVMAKYMWIFMEPFSRQLWLTILTACFFVGISIGILELRAIDSSPEFEGPLLRQLSIMLWIPISMVVFREKRVVVNKWYKFVLSVWLVLSLILLQCYVAKFFSMLTADDQPPRFLNELERPYVAGYHKGSSVKDFLVKELNFSESHLRAYSTIDEYRKALSKRSHGGGVDAIFDEEPNVKRLLHKYASKYTVVGPIDKASGFDFKISGYLSISPQSPSLQARSFGGLFIITGAATIIALVSSEISRRFSRRLPSNRLESRVHSTAEMIVVEDSPITDNQEHRLTTSNQSDDDDDEEDDNEEEEEEEVVVVVLHSS